MATVTKANPTAQRVAVAAVANSATQKVTTAADAFSLRLAQVNVVAVYESTWQGWDLVVNS
jgi:hypothetical protein